MSIRYLDDHLDQQSRAYRCKLCGRRWPKALLNVEAAIHHDSSITCFDQKSCRRARRKNAKRRK